jgi:hypothetical protein
MEHRFRARVRGFDPERAAHIVVPKFVMRALAWGRYVRIVATINDKHAIGATIINVGWGPSFLLPQQACTAAGVELNEHVSISIRTAH